MITAHPRVSPDAERLAWKMAQSLSDAVLIGELRQRGFSPLRVVSPALITIGPMSLDTVDCRLVWDGQTYRLTGQQSELVIALANAWPRSVSRDRLIVAIWGSASVVSLPPLIHRTRKVIGVHRIVGSRPSGWHPGWYRLNVEE